jgi:hypothetical protein
VERSDPISDLGPLETKITGTLDGAPIDVQAVNWSADTATVRSEDLGTFTATGTDYPEDHSEAMEEELQRTKPPTDPDLDRAQALLEDFARFWDAEPQPAERRKLILSLFAQVWAKDGQIVAVKPNTAFARYFTAASEVRAKHPKAEADGEATKAGATGLEPAASGVTGASTTTVPRPNLLY